MEDIWVHGVVTWDGEQFACGVESSMDSIIEAWWEYLLVGELKGCALLGECVLWLVGSIFA